MSETKHTPGPWKVKAAEFKPRGVVAYEIKMPIQRICQADADLIESVHAMRAALELAEIALVNCTPIGWMPGHTFAGVKRFNPLASVRKALYGKKGGAA